MQGELRPDGLVVPQGKTGEQKHPGIKKDELDLIYNEYIVYDVKQIKARYLVEVKFTKC